MHEGYDAFISYSHADSAAAARIQRFIEDFRLPPGESFAGRRIRLFRDHTDIRTGDLPSELNAALSRSRRLILCCSPHAAASRWVRQEVEAFVARPEGEVLPILLAGEPSEAIPAALAGREIRYADLRGAWRLGLLREEARLELARIVATLVDADLRSFIPWHEARRRRQRMSLGTGAAVGLAVLAALGTGFVVQLGKTALAEKNEKVEKENRGLAEDKAKVEEKNRVLAESQRHSAVLRGRGEAAVAALRSGDAAAGLALLDDLVREDGAGEFPGYRRLHGHLRPRFVPLAETLAVVPRNGVFRWRGSNYLKQEGPAVGRLPGPGIELHGTSGSGRHLVTVDALRTVTVYHLPDLRPFVAFPLGEARPTGLYENPRDGSLAVAARELGVDSDEDRSDAQFEGDAFLARIGPADGSHAILKGAAAPHCLPGPEALCGLRPLAAPPAGGGRALLFPRLRPEREFWAAAEGQAVPAAWRSDTLASREQRRQANLRRFDRLDFSSLRLRRDQLQDLRRRFTDDVSTPEFFEAGGVELVRAVSVEGNQWVAENLCRLRAPPAVEACARIDHTARSRLLYSPDGRYLLLLGHEVQEGAFRLFALARDFEPCTGFPDPAERTLSAEFAADARRLAVLTRDDELWVYGLDGACGVALLRRIAHPAFARWRAEARPGDAPVRPMIAFAGPELVLVGRGSRGLLAFDAASGLLRWSLDATGPGGAGRLRIAASPDGRTVAIHDATRLRVLDAEFGVAVGATATFAPAAGGPDDGIGRVTVGEDGTVLAEWIVAGRARVFRREPPPESARRVPPGTSLGMLTAIGPGGAPVEDLAALASPVPR